MIPIIKTIHWMTIIRINEPVKMEQIALLLDSDNIKRHYSG